MTTPRYTAQSAPADTGRFGQLTYTSYSAPAGSGLAGRSGWQPKDQTAGLTDGEQTALVGWVSTQLDPVTPIPPFPTAADIAALPRRLMYVSIDARSAVYCHTVPAGADAAGRPGNVFAHILLDRDIGETNGVRPIDLWRSPDWLTPFGQTSVATAELEPGQARPRRGRAIERSTVLQFLLTPGFSYIGILRVLLDAVEHSLRGGPRIVLAVDDPDTAALWIGAVSYFMAAVTAARLSWTTFDRADSVASAIRSGLHIVAIPARDSAAIQDSAEVVLVDTTQPVQPGEFGRSDHHTQRGTIVPITGWSALAETVLLNYATADQALQRVEEIAARVPEPYLTPGWPLAMVVAGNPLLHEAKEAARQIIDRESPASLKRDPVLLASAAGVLFPTLGTTAEGAWNALADTAVDTSPGGLTRDVVGRMFVVLALRDPDWLGREQRFYETRFVPDAGQEPTDLSSEARDAVHELACRAQEVGADWVQCAHVSRTALRMLELLDYAGLISDDIDAVMREVLVRTLRPLLYDHIHGPEFVAAIGSITEHVRTAFVLPAVVPEEPVVGRPLGERFAGEVGQWLLGADTVRFAALTRAPALIETSLYQLVADSVFRIFRSYDGQHRRDWAWAAPIGLSRALYEEHSRQDWRSTDITPLFTDEPWDIDELLSVDAQWHNMIPPRFFRLSLIETCSPAELAALTHRISRRTGSSKSRSAPLTGTPHDDALDEVAATWARLATVDWRGFHRTEIRTLWPLLADYGQRREPRLPAPLATDMAVAYILLRSKEFEHPTAPRVLTLGTAHAVALANYAVQNWQATVAGLLALIDHTGLDAHWVCVLAVLAAPTAPPSAARQSDDPLLLMRKPGGRTIFEEVAVQAMRNPHRWDAPRTEAALVDAVKGELRDRTAESGQLIHEFDRFTRIWHNANCGNGVRQ
ncbi:hypothetical protein ACQPW1_24530 [Nocardia sp. CA-128927]|uniref:GAP1-N2 domain-containing protein n=1 Tax=Nocardia sp. CA-128927 TaxID=3239975 RepID=UPI003D972880